ncbi:MAG: hypothetical protein ACM34I_01090 [bacterium]
MPGRNGIRCYCCQKPFEADERRALSGRHHHSFSRYHWMVF